MIELEKAIRMKTFSHESFCYLYETAKSTFWKKAMGYDGVESGRSLNTR